MMKKMPFVLGSVLFFVSLIAQVFAADSADLQLTTLTTEQCPYTTVQIIGHLTNTGTGRDTYTITSDSEWVKIAPDALTLAAGERATVYVYLTPELANEGRYSINVNVRSNNGAKDSATISLNLLRCYGVELDAKATTQTACIGDRAAFSVNVTNAGKYSETFEVITNNNVQDATEVTLASGQSRTLSIQVPVTKDKQAVSLVARSQTSYASDSLSLNLNGAVCYTSTISATPQSATVCAEEKATFAVNIKNTGTKPQNFTLSSNAGTWSSRTISLNAGENKTVSLTHTPTTTGTTEFNIEANSANQKLTASTILTAIDCTGVAVLVTPDKSTAVKGDSVKLTVTVKNTGRKADTYAITSSIGTATPARIDVNGGETRTATVTVDTSNLSIGTHNVTVTAKGAVTDSSVVQIVVEEGHAATFRLSGSQDTNVCPNENAEFLFMLANTGKRPDTYTITATNGKPSETKVTLEAGKTRNITIVVPSTYKDEGTKSTNVTATGINLNESIKLNVGYKSFDTCYGFELSATPQTDTIRSYKPEDYEAALYTITVRNKGMFNNSYTFTAQGPNWSYVDPKSLSLKAGTSGETFAYMAPPYRVAAGTYEATITARSVQNISKSVTVRLVFEHANGLGNQTTTDAGTNRTATGTGMTGTYDARFNNKDYILLTADETENVSARYTNSNNSESVFTVQFSPTPFTIRIGNVSLSKRDISRGTNQTLFLVTAGKRYEINLDMADLNTNPEFYKFRVNSIEVTENLGATSQGTQLQGLEVTNDSQANATQEPAIKAPRNTKLLLGILGLAILAILAIAYWPQISKKMSSAKTAKKSEKSDKKKKKSEKKEDIKEILNNI